MFLLHSLDRRLYHIKQCLSGHIMPAAKEGRVLLPPPSPANHCGCIFLVTFSQNIVHSCLGSESRRYSHISLLVSPYLDKALIKHRINNLYKSGNIGTYHVVPLSTITLTSINTGSVYGLHDLLQPIINLFTGPGKAH